MGLRHGCSHQGWQCLPESRPAAQHHHSYTCKCLCLFPRTPPSAAASAPGPQPWRSFKPDGVILFSDILTPLPGIGVSFEIDDNKGPLLDDPIRSADQVSTLRLFASGWGIVCGLDLVCLLVGHDKAPLLDGPNRSGDQVSTGLAGFLAGWFSWPALGTTLCAFRWQQTLCRVALPGLVCKPGNVLPRPSASSARRVTRPVN